MREITGNMKKGIFSLIIAALLISVVYVSVVLKDDLNDDEIDNTSGQSPINNISDLVDSSNEFSFDMYQELIDEDENVFFSPYSITTALGMAYEGARGQTADEMSQVLNLSSDNQTRWDLMKEFQSKFNTDSDSYDLSTANAYWLRNNEQLNEIYKTAIESYYLAHGEELDFAGDPAGSAEIINEWVEQQTNGKIKDLISPDDISLYTYLILTNAIYFKSDWKYQFDVDATTDRTFNLANGDDIETEMMHMNDESISLNYSSNDDVQLLQLPYKDGELSMYIMLPIENDISYMESKLNNDYFNDLKGDMAPEYMSLFLPKFKFELKYLLNDMLCEMGMPTAFSDDADFSGIGASPGPLKISKVIHQSFVEVNEEGTEAAAATAVIMDNYSIVSYSPQPIVFNADHPFIFFIEHEVTGQILFMGKVGNPAE